MVKILKSLVRTISEHLLKAIFQMFETKTVAPCLVWKVNWGWRSWGGGGYGPPGPPSVTTLL